MSRNKPPSLVCQKRLEKEFNELINTPLPNIKAVYEPTNILNWYCMIYDLTDDEYEDGEYIFNIKMSPNYPFEPPEFYFLTPNGRFDTDRKLCFSNSSYHTESWSPMWTMKTIIIGFLSFFLEKSSTGVGHLNSAKDIKMKYAVDSSDYNQKKLSSIIKYFQDVETKNLNNSSTDNATI